MNSRPQTLAEIARDSDSLAAFGRSVRDWLHEARRHSSRPQFAAMIAAEPPTLAERFPDGRVADAYLAAYAEWVAARVKIVAPAWAFAAERVAETPWFADGALSDALRTESLRCSPSPFKRRNLFTRAVEWPASLRRGRPLVGDEQKRLTRVACQRRFRARRKAELIELRRQAAGSA